VKVGPRLAKLEATMPKGCAECRAWSGTVLVDDAGAATRPGRCPACGRSVPIQTLVHLVGVPLEAV